MWEFFSSSEVLYQSEISGRESHLTLKRGVLSWGSLSSEPQEYMDCSYIMLDKLRLGHMEGMPGSLRL